MLGNSGVQISGSRQWFDDPSIISFLRQAFPPKSEHRAQDCGDDRDN